MFAIILRVKLSVSWTVLYRRSASSSPVLWREVGRCPRHPQGPPIKGPLQSGPVPALLLSFTTLTSHAVKECIEGRRLLVSCTAELHKPFPV